jgi:hypothetical protein
LKLIVCRNSAAGNIIAEQKEISAQHTRQSPTRLVFVFAIGT